MNPRDEVIIREMIHLCETGVQLANRGDEWFFGDPENVPGLAAESLIIKLGENVARLSLETLEAHPNVPWSLVKRMRDLLAHHYEGTDYEVVWDTLLNDLPFLGEQLQSVIPRQN